MQLPEPPPSLRHEWTKLLMSMLLAVLLIQLANATTTTTNSNSTVTNSGVVSASNYSVPNGSHGNAPLNLAEIDRESSTEYDIDLDSWDKLLIVVVVVAFLGLVLLLLVCVLNTSCPLHAVCPIDYGDGCKKAKPVPGPVYGSMDEPVNTKSALNGNGHHIKSHGNDRPRERGQSPKIHKAVSRHRHLTSRSMRDSSEQSDWSDISLPEMIELKQDLGSKHRKTSRTSDYSSSASSVHSPVQYESRIAYGLSFDRSHNKLYIRVIQLGNFRVTDPDGALSPYVKVRVYRTPRHFFSFKLKSPRELPLHHLEAEMQTRIQRRTDNPVFNEYFEMDAEETDLASFTIKFLVCDYDRFSRHIVVGEVTVDVSKVNLSSGDEILANDLIEAHHEDNLGDLHVALMYLPTAEKLNLSILNARGLPATESFKKNTETLVKVVMMFDGRPLKKVKTLPKPHELSPVFSDNFVFDVPAYQLDKVYFHLVVIAIEKEREDGRHVLGRVYLGVNFDPDARTQWLEMVHNARKQVACWHKLRS